MADNEPAAKRLKRDKFVFDSSSEDDDDNTVIRSIEMDVSNDICTSDDSENDWLSQSSNRGEQLKHKPLLLKVPRGKLMVPESVKNPGTASVSDTRKSVITPEQFDALNVMPLEHICIFAEASKAFKEIALKFFPMKYRNMNLAQLINPETRKYSLDSARRMLKIFGHLVWSLDLSLEILDDPRCCADLIALVRNHCAETLGWLSI